MAPAGVNLYFTYHAPATCINVLVVAYPPRLMYLYSVAFPVSVNDARKPGNQPDQKDVEQFQGLAGR